MNDDELFAGLEDIFSEVVSSPPENIRLLEDGALLELYEDLTTELKVLDQLLNPRTQAARELQSRRAACVIELRNRGQL